MNVIEDLQQKILSMATEDLNGLWEVVWYLRTLFPSHSESYLASLAENKVRDLWKSDYIYFCYYNSSDNTETPLPFEQVDAAISNPKNWLPPATIDTVHIRFAVTEKGESAYYKNTVG